MQCHHYLLTSVWSYRVYPTLYQVSTAYEEYLVTIDMYLYTAPPGPPTGVTAVQSGPTSVSVSWSAPTSGGPVSRYDVYYMANGVPSTGGGSTNSTSYVLTNLQVGVQYNISVIAVGIYIPSCGSMVPAALGIVVLYCDLLQNYTARNLDSSKPHFCRVCFLNLVILYNSALTLNLRYSEQQCYLILALQLH